MRGRSALSIAAIFETGVVAGLAALCALAAALAGCDPCPSCSTTTPPPPPGAAHFVTSGSMTDPRIAHTGTLLDTGQVLMAGGYEIPGTLDSAEIYDPAARTFTATRGAMTQARDHHSATLLNDNTVLITGGDNGYGPLVATAFLSAELFDPTIGRFKVTGAMFAPRTWHTATLLADGKVLVAGGSPAVESVTGVPIGALPNAELYEPSSKQFFGNPGSMNDARSEHTASLIKGCACRADEQVLLAGGVDASGATLNSAELFEESTNSFTPTGRMNMARHNHTATTLSDGKVLITGGVNNAFGLLDSAEIYDPKAGTFTPTATPMTTARAFHSAQLLRDGQHVLIAGGGVDSNGNYVLSAEIFDPSKGGSFTATAGHMTDVRFEGASAQLPNGLVLITGGARLFLPDGELRFDSSVDTAEIFSPGSGDKFSAGTFSATSSMVHRRVAHTATMLNDDRILIAGGADLTTQILDTSELYDPAAGGVFNCVGGTKGTDCASSLHNVRFSQTATALNGSSRVLIAGGSDGTNVAIGGMTVFTGIKTAEIYNSASKTYTCVGGLSLTGVCNDSMTHARIDQVAVLLKQGGMVMIAGGDDATGAETATAELYDPAIGKFTATTHPMNNPRAEFSGALITSPPLAGQVLISGGCFPCNPPNPKDFNTLNSAELYDPSTGKFSFTGSMAQPRFLHTETLITSGPNRGDILVAGGSGDQSAEIYVPATGSFKPAGDMTEIVFQPNVATLTSGEILVAGGATINAQGQLEAVSGAELYDPTKNQFSATDSMTTGRWMAADAFLDPALVSGSEAGDVLIAGGEGVNATLASSELFVPGTATTSSTAAVSPAISALTPAQKQQAVAQALAALTRMASAGLASRQH